MDNVENIIILICSLISAITIFLYYFNSKQSSCFDCKTLINHYKENRYSITVNDEDNALCKKCFNKRKQQDSLIAQNCSCCLRRFTTRMKIHEWEVNTTIYYLCSICNKKGENQLRSSFQLADVLTDEFIQANTNATSLQEYTDNSCLKIENQNDLNTPEWNNFVVQSSKFTSWKNMESKALSELYYQQRLSVINALCKST